MWKSYVFGVDEVGVWVGWWCGGWIVFIVIGISLVLCMCFVDLFYLLIFMKCEWIFVDSVRKLGGVWF